MKKFIIKSSILLLGVVVVNLVFLLLVMKTDWGFRKRMESLNFVNPEYEWLTIGSSLSMDGFDTEYITKKGIKAYNLAIGGNSLDATYIQLEEYLNTYPNKPKLVILGENSHSTDMGSYPVNPIVELTRKNHKYVFEDIPLIAFKWLGIDFTKKLVSKKHRDAQIVLGQLKFTKQTPDKGKLKPDQVFQYEKYIKSKGIKNLIDLCNQHKVKLIIVEMPANVKSRHKKIFDYYTLDKENNNGILVDLNHFEFCKIFDDKKDWISTDHLNVYGAEKFTIALMQELERMKLIP